MPFTPFKKKTDKPAAPAAKAPPFATDVEAEKPAVKKSRKSASKAPAKKASPLRAGLRGTY